MSRAAALMSSTALSPFETKEAQAKDDPVFNAEIKGQIDEAVKAIHDMRAANDERYDELKKGRDDFLTKDKLEKANADIDEKVTIVNTSITDLKKQFDDLEVAMKRSLTNGANDEKAEKRLGEAKSLMLQCTKHGDRFGDGEELEFLGNYEAGYQKYLRTTQDNPASAGRFGTDQFKALTVGGDPNGGFWVPPTQSGRTITKIFETSELRGIASVETIGTDRLEFVLDRQEGSQGWVGEVAARPETGTAETGKLEIPVFEQYAMPKASQNLLDDAQFDVEGWLARKTSAKFARAENTAFVNGNGTSRPHGFLDYATAATADASRAFGVLQHVATGVDGDWPAQVASHDGPKADKLIDLIAELNPAFLAGARFAMQRRVLAEIRQFKDADGRYLVQPDITQTGLQFMLFGYPVSMFEDMPVKASDSLSVSFGNFAEGYTIVDRQGIRLLVDPYTDKPNIRFYTTKRVGGSVTDSDAIKHLKFGTV